MTDIAAGENHSLAIDGFGVVWGWGDNRDGQLGSVGSSTSAERMVTGLTGATAITAGLNHSLAIAGVTDQVWAWGTNGSGELGNNSALPGADSSTPVMVEDVSMVSLAGASRIAAGYSFSMAVVGIADDVYTWGRNRSGQLGNGDTGLADLSYAAAIPSFSGISEIGAGGYQGLAIVSGVVWSWGNNWEAQIGSDPSALNLSLSPVAVPVLSTASMVAGGGTHSLAVQGGAAWAWGDNRLGPLG